MRPQLPVEVWVLSGFAVFWAVCLMWFPISLPDAGAMHFIQTHYFAPLELAVGLQVVAVGWMFWRTRRGTLCAPLVTSGLLAFTVVAVFLHFNFKAWMPLANPVLFDRLYAGIDRAIAPALSLCLALRSAVADVSPIDVDGWYHHAFVGMFFASYLVHGACDSLHGFRRLVLTINLVLLVGGISYWLLPAIGPFLTTPGVNLQAHGPQQAMLFGFKQVLQTGALPEGYFVNPPAAMPSLHFAHAIVMTRFAWRLRRWFGVVYVPILGWIAIEAIASGFHYAIDLPAGWAVAWLCERVTNRVLPSTRFASTSATPHERPRGNPSSISSPGVGLP